MDNETPQAATFNTPQVSSDYAGLVRDAISAQGDVVNSVQEQLRSSISNAHQIAADTVNSIHNGIRQRVSEGITAAGSVASQVRQQIHDQVQHRISQAGSMTAVISQQIDQQECWYAGCPNNADGEPISGQAAVAVIGPCGLAIGQIIHTGEGGVSSYTVMMGPFPQPPSLELLQTITCGGPSVTQPPGWWVCCCGQSATTTPPPPNCSWGVHAEIDWDGDTDYDLYMYGPSGMCFWEHRSAPPLTLNTDAHPDCDTLPEPPEIITGQFQNSATLRVFYNNFKPDCGQNTPLKTNYVRITNNSDSPITVNGTSVTGGGNWSAPIPLDSSVGNQSTYTGGLTLDVVCPSSVGGGGGGGSLPPPPGSHTLAASDGGCNIAQVIQNPPAGALCIKGPFPDQQSAQQWLDAAIASGQAQMLCSGIPTQTCPACPACPICPQCGNGPCNCPPPVVNCPTPQININVAGVTTNTYNNQQYISNVQNITSTVNNIQNTTNEYIRNIRETINNITNRNVYNQQRTINNITDTYETTINRYLGEVTTYIDSLNTITNVGAGGGGSAGRSFILSSDGTWKSEIDPSTDPELESLVTQVRKDTITDYTAAEAVDFDELIPDSPDYSGDIYSTV